MTTVLVICPPNYKAVSEWNVRGCRKIPWRSHVRKHSTKSPLIVGDTHLVVVHTSDGPGWAELKRQAVTRIRHLTLTQACYSTRQSAALISTDASSVCLILWWIPCFHLYLFAFLFPLSITQRVARLPEMDLLFQISIFGSIKYKFYSISYKKVERKKKNRERLIRTWSKPISIVT